jgi:hypothetical protein
MEEQWRTMVFMVGLLLIYYGLDWFAADDERSR